MRILKVKETHLVILYHQGHLMMAITIIIRNNNRPFS